MEYRESGYLGEGEGRPLCWSETCRAGSLRQSYFLLSGTLSVAPTFGISELGPGHHGAPTPRLVAMTHGSISAERHCRGRMQMARSGVSL